MASIITDEHPAERPIVLEGVGPQLRIYCRYGLEAVEEGSSVDALTWNPTAGDWTMHVPCDDENIPWVIASLKQAAPRIKVFDVAEEVGGDDGETSAGRSSKTASIVVDWNLKD